MSTQVSQPKAFMTAEELKELFEMPDDDYRYELVKGELIKMKLSILILALIVLAVYFLPGQTFAQTHPVDGTYLTDWLVIGPFFPNDLKTDFLANVGGEANIQPKESDKVITKDGKTLTWKRYKAKANAIQLHDALGNHENATAYAFCSLQSDIGGETQIYLSHDDGTTVWINGKQAYHEPNTFIRDSAVFEVSLKPGANRCLLKVSQNIGSWHFSMWAKMLPQKRAVLSGLVTDEKGKAIPNAEVRLEQNGSEIARTNTDVSGKYVINVYPISGTYDLSAVDGNRGDWQLNLRLFEGERRKVNFTLRDEVSISGTLLAFDGSPHVAVPVQAILTPHLTSPTRGEEVGRESVTPRNLYSSPLVGEEKGGGKVIATTLSDESGKYQFINLKPGRYQVRCYTSDGYVYYGSNSLSSSPSPLAGEGQGEGKTLQLQPSKNLSNIDFRFAPFKKGMWKSYNTLDGLADTTIFAIHQDQAGLMWFGTYGGGISRYDGKRFVNFTTKDGLVDNRVWSIHRDPDGVMWFGTGGGISRYDGKRFVNFTTKDGLAGNYVYAIHQDPDGVMWFGTWGGGISRYDGERFINFTEKDGLANNQVFAIYRDSDRIMWFGTLGGGVSRYDDIAWASLDTRDGLAGNEVRTIYQDSDGSLWFGTESGITRYRKSTASPSVRIVSVRTQQLYTDLSSVPAIVTGSRVTIEYNAIDFNTVPEKQQYRIRLINMDRDVRARQIGRSKQRPYNTTDFNNGWEKPTKSTMFDWVPKKPGKYIFEVQAIDRDLNYSKPASLQLTISPPPFYTRLGFIIGSILTAFFIPTATYGALHLRQKRQQVFEPIPNPYIVGNPIRNKDMFFGREDDFAFVANKLAGGQNGMVIVFCGERRSGKTSILYQIMDGRLGENFISVLIDMQAMTVNSEAEFFEKIADITSTRIGNTKDTINYDFRSESLNPTRTFEKFIDNAMTSIKGKSLLLLFDEYELLEVKIDQGVLSDNIITFFASILERHPNISFIFTGSSYLEKRPVEYWNRIIPKSIYRKISFLSERDALRLISDPVKDTVRYHRQVPQIIYRLSSGQPFYTQVICQNLVDRLNSEQRNRVLPQDLETVVTDLSDNPLPQMIYFWDDLKRGHQIALALVAEILDNPDSYVTVKQLIDFIANQAISLQLTETEIQMALDELCDEEILDRERVGEGRYEYRYRVDLFRHWVRRGRSIWQVVAS